jgi:hypothetical protein
VCVGRGGGILRLHSTFRHDLKIKASDEGRVMKTAAAFTKVRALRYKRGKPPGLCYVMLCVFGLERVRLFPHKKELFDPVLG